ncbi:DapH/DapD/GlmU-related protein [Paenibacillus amylolyticus]|nr:DapH/DapD/GlmU-related protein [Paenibacillus amylolyticus]
MDLGKRHSVRGVTIGDGCVIGAGSVVTRDIPPHSFAAGVPCRVIRNITEADSMRNYPGCSGRLLCWKNNKRLSPGSVDDPVTAFLVFVLLGGVVVTQEFFYFCRISF